jgi:hypothetical protein
VLDSLINREDAAITRTCQPPMTENGLQTAQYLIATVAINPNVIYMGGSGKVKRRLVNGFAGVVQEEFGLIAQ